MSRKETKDKHFLKQPVYRGGKGAMDLLIKQALNYPKEAIENKIEGSVYLTYGIDFKGKVKEVKVLSGIGYGCDEEAKRLVKLFKFEIPKIPRRMKVLFNKNIRIHFRLPKEKESKITYSISTSETKSEPSNGSKGYSYTIDW